MPSELLDDADARWCELADAQSAGEELSEEELAFLRQHREDLAERDAETDLLADLGKLSELEPLSADDHALAESVLAEFRDESGGGDVIAFPRRVVAIAGIAVAGLAAAAALALWMRPAPAPTAPQVAVAPPTAPTATGPVLRSGGFSSQGASLAVGDEIVANTLLTATVDGSCIGDVVCADKDTRLQMLGDDGAAIEVQQGRVRVDGHFGPLEVVTFEGKVASDGGRFTVEVTREEVIVVVLVGPVTVSDDQGERELASGAQLRLGQEPVEPVEPVVEDDGGNQPVAKPVQSASDMLARAQELRGAGEKRRAASAYEQLLKVHPASPEAHAAAVTLGKLQLGLGKSRAALRAFDRYLKKGGALEEEAAYGRIQALERLGKTDELQSAIEAFASRYPRSVYRTKVQALADSSSG